MAAPPPWPDRVWHMLQWRLTGRQTQRNIRGALALKQSIVKGNPALPVTHTAFVEQNSLQVYYSTTEWHFIILGNSLNWWYQQSFSFSLVFLIYCHSFSSFHALTLLPILYLQVFFSFVTWIQRSLNPVWELSIWGLHSAFISSSQHGIRLLFCHSDIQFSPFLHYSNNESSPYSIIPSFQYVI